MNELKDYPSIQFDHELYNSLRSKDSRIIIRKIRALMECYEQTKQLDQELFTVLYFSVQQLQKDDIIDYIASEILLRSDSIEFEVLQLKFLSTSIDFVAKNKKESVIDLQKQVLLQFGCFEKHGQRGLDILLNFYSQKIKEQDVKFFLQNQIKKLLRKETNHNYIKNRLIQVSFNSDDCDQQLADLIVYSDNISFITSYITILAQSSIEISQNESNALKQVSKIFSLISASLPNLFNQNLPVFLQFYDSENYCLRNSANVILTNILTQHLNPSEVDQDFELSEMQTKQKILLIDKLCTRIMDKNAYARVHTLKMLRIVCSQNLIPATILLQLFPLIIGRSADVSSQVRKAALAFIKQITKFMKNLFVDGLQVQSFMKLEEIEVQNQFLQKEICKSNVAIEQIIEEKGKTTNEEIFKELEDEEQLVVANLKEKKKLLYIFTQYLQFMRLVQQVLPNVEQLLSSKCITDIFKAISLISFLFKQKIENTDIGIMKMLIHSSNTQVVQKVAKKFISLFLENENQEISLGNLFHLFKIASPKEQIYLEQILNYMIKNQMLPQSLTEIIWNNFIKMHATNQLEQLDFYSRLVRIFYCQFPSLLIDSKHDQINKIVDHQKKDINWITVIEVAKLVKFLENKYQIKQYFSKLALLLYFYFGVSSGQWFVACQEILNLISFLPVPESINEYIIKKFSYKLFSVGMVPKNTQDFLEEESDLIFNNNSLKLSQLLFIVGQSALTIILHLDDVENQLKHLKTLEEQKENDLDKIQGGCEAEYEYNSLYLQNLCSYDTLQKGFYKNYVPIIMDILAEIDQEVEPTILHKNASLCLCKFMCLSEKFCEQNIEKIFKWILLKNVDGVFKNNMIVAIGDLLHRWPNTVTSYCRQLFDGLNNQDFIVKKTSLNMLSHLILNDMIKIKREITDIALLLADEDENIQQQARRFFFQLHKKDQRRIINSLPDIIFSMSTEESSAKYKIFLINILKYLDKSSEQLTEKLLRRLKDNIDDFEIQNISFTLSKLQMKEALAKKFYECYPYYQERLENPQIKEYFYIIISKVIEISICQLMKCGLNQENKQILQEFEELLQKGETKRRPFSTKLKSSKSTRTQNNSQQSAGYSNMLDSIFSQATEQ